MVRVTARQYFGRGADIVVVRSAGLQAGERDGVVLLERCVCDLVFWEPWRRAVTDAAVCQHVSPPSDDDGCRAHPLQMRFATQVRRDRIQRVDDAQFGSLCYDAVLAGAQLDPVEIAGQDD